MATTNYSLPTLESTALFDLVTDYNALANATDAALASVAGLIPTESITEMQGQISALQTLTGSQRAQITTLQSQMSTANGNISTLQSGLETANGNIGTLQTGLQTANQNISNNTASINTLKTQLNNLYELSSTYYQDNNIFSGANGILYVAKNTDNSIVKIYGSVFTQSAVAKTTVPGATWTSGDPIYGIKTNIQIMPPSSNGYFIQGAGLSSSADASPFNGFANYAIGSDGYLYLQCNSVSTSERIFDNHLLQIPLFLTSPFSQIGEI